jgi:hypothetical protein
MLSLAQRFLDLEKTCRKRAGFWKNETMRGKIPMINEQEASHAFICGTSLHQFRQQTAAG